MNKRLPILPTENEAIDMLSKFYKDPDYEKLKRIYLTKSFSEIMSIDRREMSHSTFLAWLLKDKESHGLEDFSLKQLLKIIVKRDFQQDITRHSNAATSTESIAPSIMNEEFQFDKLEITPEKHVATNKTKGRIDIRIEGNIYGIEGKNELNIVIENKVYSKENVDQTQKYFDSERNNIKDDSINLFVYLTPLSKKELDALDELQCTCKEYTQINYQDILDEILEPALTKEIPERTKFILEEYINCLSLPAIDLFSNSKNNIKNTVMATRNNVEEMLYKFLENHEKLLTAALRTLREKTENEDLQNKIDHFLTVWEVNNRRSRDKTHYVFMNIPANGKNQLLYTVIPKILQISGISTQSLSDTYNNTINELKDIKDKDIYNNLKNILEEKMTCPSSKELGKPKNLKLVLNKEEYNELIDTKKKKTMEKIYTPIKGIYIYNQWTYDTIDYFVYTFYINRKAWGMSDKKYDIMVIKQISQ